MPYTDINGRVWTVFGPADDDGDEGDMPGMSPVSVATAITTTAGPLAVPTIAMAPDASSPPTAPAPATSTSEAVGAGIRATWTRITERENARRGFKPEPAVASGEATGSRGMWAKVVGTINARLPAKAILSEPQASTAMPTTDRERWRKIIENLNGAVGQ